MDEQEFYGRLRVDVSVVKIWIEQGWLVPRQAEGRAEFTDMDVARAELIGDLIDGMGVNEAGVDVVMDLIDQIHGLRGTLSDLRRALGDQDEAIQISILRSMGRRR
ncbi:MAG: transcriptional regulator [Rhizobiales bacterium 63-7]|uniref:chaperone modulator CbpM n=1 Tax=Rhizobium sp. YJ-22 TaxID=3037556 RepID=UPI000925B934|nr:chaperone modulator CbpM [Rhizobium sp. YJ-22]MBN9033274.1 MerR family transcriptional regulator [Hyphomicrobiales bacterium]MDG3578217.1 chaperone modulator CbpM [Rhizobium sp. YJ-22]OJU71881.1 MAG: transcriptional regulator [Rhizobiales bacterium 63-7]